MKFLAFVMFFLQISLMPISAAEDECHSHKHCACHNGLANCVYGLLQLNYYGFQHLSHLHVEAQNHQALNQSLHDLVTSRFDKNILTNSVHFIFSGDGEFYTACGTSGLRGGQRVFCFFAPDCLDEQILKTTPYEFLEHFLDAMFGLTRGQEGLPPPAQRNGNLATLLCHKFDFILGTKRDGCGHKYGASKTPNHFSDQPQCKGKFPGIKGGADLIPGSRVTAFFDSYKVTTDYERLKILLDISLCYTKSK